MTYSVFMTIFPQEHFVNLHLFRQNFQPAWHMPLVPSLTRFRDCNMMPSWWPLVWHLWLQQVQGYQEGVVKIASILLHGEVTCLCDLLDPCGPLDRDGAMQCNAMPLCARTRPELDQYCTWSIWSFPSSDAVWHLHHELLKNISSAALHIIQLQLDSRYYWAWKHMLFN